MGRKITPGLRKRGEIWHIEKTVKGVRLFESTGESDLEKAEQYLAKRIEEIRQEKVWGVRKKRTFNEAAAKYLLDYEHKRSIGRDANCLKWLCLTSVNSTWTKFTQARLTSSLQTGKPMELPLAP
jgi:hypothetical protein